MFWRRQKLVDGGNVTGNPIQDRRNLRQLKIAGYIGSPLFALMAAICLIPNAITLNAATGMNADVLAAINANIVCLIVVPGVVVPIFIRLVVWDFSR